VFQRVHVSLLRLKPCVQLQWNVQESDQWHRYGDPISWDPSLGFKPICAIVYNEFLIDSSTLDIGATLFRHLQEEPNSIFLRSISEIRNIQCQTNLSNYPMLSKPQSIIVSYQHEMRLSSHPRLSRRRWAMPVFAHSARDRGQPELWCNDRIVSIDSSFLFHVS